jgi:branched-chain amino acid transport system substrate-binding protein
MSGPAAAYGEAHHNGTQLALDEINKAGGFNGQPIEVFTEDDRSDPAAGINAAKKMIAQRKVDVLVGSSASLVTLAFSKENEKYKIPLVNGQAGSPTITEQGYKYTWRINLTDAQLDEKAVEHYFSVLGKKKFAFLVENSDYGKPPTKVAAEKIKALGGEVTAYEEYNRGETDFKAQLTNIKSSNPEVVFVHGYYTEGSIIARQLKELGINAQLIVNGGQGIQKFIELAGAASEGAVFPTIWLPGLPDERSRKFEAAFRAKYKSEPGQYEAGTYESIYTVLGAAKAGAGSSPAQIQDGLHKLKNFETIVGKINFDAKNQNNGDVRFGTFENGKIVPLK